MFINSEEYIIISVDYMIISADYRYLRWLQDSFRRLHDNLFRLYDNSRYSCGKRIFIKINLINIYTIDYDNYRF